MPSTVVPGAVVDAGASEAPCWIGSFSGPIVPPPGWVGPVEEVVAEVVPVACLELDDALEPQPAATNPAIPSSTGARRRDRLRRPAAGTGVGLSPGPRRTAGA